jgi:hypothetical protein
MPFSVISADHQYLLVWPQLANLVKKALYRSFGDGLAEDEQIVYEKPNDYSGFAGACRHYLPVTKQFSVCA